MTSLLANVCLSACTSPGILFSFNTFFNALYGIDEAAKSVAEGWSTFEEELFMEIWKGEELELELIK